MIRFLLGAFAMALVAFIAAAYGSMRYLTDAPGVSYHGVLPALTTDEAELGRALARHIGVIAAREHNMAHPDALESVAQYLETTLADYGYTVNRHPYFVDDRAVRNLDVIIDPVGAAGPAETIVVGAHYDSARTAPGANDNATGTAAVLELARLLRDVRQTATRRIRLALFVNEEPPYFQTTDMGSVHYAEMLADQRERAVAMFSLETLGFYSSEPGSQQYPVPFGLVLPSRGDFVAFVGSLGARPLLRQTVASFRSHSRLPSLAGVAPDVVPGIDWSDHWAFGELGIPSLMITDTAVYRYPHYHRPTDTPDKIDVDKLARVVKGIEWVIRDATR